MDDLVGKANLLASALVEGRTMRELLRLQVFLQLLSSAVNAEIALRRSAPS